MYTLNEANKFGNPPVPFEQRIPGKLTEGRRIRIEGKVTTSADHRFEVNLNSGGDIAMHLNYRFDEDAVVFNSMQANSWRQEERVANELQSRERFTILIAVDAQSYEVTVNGKYLYNFRHRLPVTSVDSIEIKGSIKLYNVDFQGNLMQAAVTLGNASTPQPGAQLPVPYTHPLPGGMWFNRQAFVSVTPTPGATRFAVNFCVNEDVAFHFNPRIAERAIVRNSRQNGTWGSEERQAMNFPFAAGQTAYLVFMTNNNGFNVAVNGVHLFEFAHRMNQFSITHLMVDGDVTLHQVHVQ